MGDFWANLRGFWVVLGAIRRPEIWDGAGQDQKTHGRDQKTHDQDQKTHGPRRTPTQYGATQRDPTRRKSSPGGRQGRRPFAQKYLSKKKTQFLDVLTRRGPEARRIMIS